MIHLVTSYAQIMCCLARGNAIIQVIFVDIANNVGKWEWSTCYISDQARSVIAVPYQNSRSIQNN